MNNMLKRLPDTAKLGLAGCALVLSGTALNTAWSAAIYPDKQNTQAYAHEIKTEIAGGLLGFSAGLLPLFLIGAGMLRRGAPRPPGL